MNDILISGAGIAGPALAHCLRHRGFRVTVVERTAAPREGGQAVDVRGVALDVVDRMGLGEPVRAARTRIKGMSMVDGAGTELFRSEEFAYTSGRLDSEDVELLRDDLIAMLHEATKDSVEYVFDDSITALHQEETSVRVEFEHGGFRTFDLVIGADGAWSRTRSAVSPATPHYTGVTSVETSLDDVDTRHPDLARLIGDGSVAVYGVNRGLVAQRNSGGHVKVGAKFRAPLDWHTDLDLADVEVVRSSLLTLFDGWAAPVLDLLRRGTAFVHRPLYVLPVSHTWVHVPGVTLLGDAAHLMPPLGAGANLAMLEGAELGESLAAAGPDELDDAVRAFEERMWARAGKWARTTADGLERLVSPDPAEALAVFDEVQPA